MSDYAPQRNAHLLYHSSLSMASLSNSSSLSFNSSFFKAFSINVRKPNILFVIWCGESIIRSSSGSIHSFTSLKSSLSFSFKSSWPFSLTFSPSSSESFSRTFRFLFNVSKGSRKLTLNFFLGALDFLLSRLVRPTLGGVCHPPLKHSSLARSSYLG